MISGSSDVGRVAADYQRWADLSERDKADFFAECDNAMEQSGFVILAGALTEEECGMFVRLIDDELETSAPVERKMNEALGLTKGFNLYNLPLRHSVFMQLICFPPVVEYFRRFLGAGMKLYNSEGRVKPPGSSDESWHYDAFDRISDYCLTLVCMYFLKDVSRDGGAPMIVPDSHKSPSAASGADRKTGRCVQVRRGDAVLLHPHLVYATMSANRSDGKCYAIINQYIRAYMRQRFDYCGMLNYVQAKTLTTEQRTLLGFDHRPTRDIHEAYRIVKLVKDEYDPYGY